MKQAQQPLVTTSCEPMTLPPLTVLLPIESYFEGRVQSSVTLHSRLTSVPLPSSWSIASTDPLTLCKLRLRQEGQADVTTTINISAELGWTVFYSDKELTSASSPLLTELPHKLVSVTAVYSLMSLLDSARVCVGNSDDKFLKLWHHRALTLHGSQSELLTTVLLSSSFCFTPALSHIDLVYLRVLCLADPQFGMLTVICSCQTTVQLFNAQRVQHNMQHLLYSATD